MSKPVCPMCGDDVSHRFSVPCDYRKPDIQKGYGVYWCSACEYGFVWPRPTREEVASFYELDEYYTHGDIAVNKKPDAFLDRLRLHLAWRCDASEQMSPDEVRPFLNGDLSVCEIGCGHGWYLSQFQKAGFDVFGVEPDAAARERSSKVTKNIFAGTAEELPAAIKARKYSVVLMSHVLEHCLDVHAAVASAKAILKDGGIFLVETPNCASFGFHRQEGTWPWSDIPRHLNFFTPNSLQRVVELNGLDVERTKYRGYCRQFSDHWLGQEEKAWTAFSRYEDMGRRPNFHARAWMSLIGSVFADKAAKYDSVRLLSRHEHSNA